MKSLIWHLELCRSGERSGWVDIRFHFTSPMFEDSGRPVGKYFFEADVGSRFAPKINPTRCCEAVAR